MCLCVEWPSIYTVCPDPMHELFNLITIWVFQICSRFVHFYLLMSASLGTVKKEEERNKGVLN